MSAVSSLLRSSRIIHEKKKNVNTLRIIFCRAITKILRLANDFHRQDYITNLHVSQTKDFDHTRRFYQTTKAPQNQEVGSPFIFSPQQQMIQRQKIKSKSF